MMSGDARHEVKFMALDLKAVDADGNFEGYASLFDARIWPATWWRPAPSPTV